MPNITLTAAQQGIWLGQQLNPDSPMYLAAEYLDFRHGLDVARFNRAWQHTLAQATALQVRFYEEQGQPMQSLLSVDATVPLIDLRHEVDAMQVALEWMQHDLQMAMDLQTQPPFRTALLQLSEQHYVWYLCIHHIASDGYSFALLTQQLAQCYQADGAPPSAFGDYTQLHQLDQTYQQSDDIARDRAYWQSLLQPSATMALPSLAADTQYADTVAQRPIRLSQHLAADTLTQLQAYAQMQGMAVSWGDLVIASVAALYYQQRGGAVCRLGIPLMGRMGSAAIRIPGMVMNMCPLLIEIGADCCFADLVQQVSQGLHQSRPHQKYRYEQLRHDIDWQGATPRLFGPVVNVMPFDRRLVFGDQPVTVHNLSAGPVEDISFGFVQLPQGQLRLDIDAHPAQYQTEDLQALIHAWHICLQQCLAQPQQPLTVNMQAMAWADGGCLQQPVLTVWQQLQRQVQLRPDAVAIVDGAQSISYAMLHQQSLQLAAYLQQQGVGENCIVAMQLPRSYWVMVTMLAIWRCGAAYVCLDPQGPDARQQQILQDAEPVMLIDTAWLNAYQTVSVEIAALPELPVQPDALAYLIYTSGSTGQPKGVMISQQALAEFLQGAQQRYQWQADDRVLQFAPYHFDACVEEIFLSLHVGATLVLRNEAMLSSMAAFQRYCQQWSISVLDLPTAFWHEWVYACQRQGWRLADSLRCVVIGGEAVQSERVKDWDALCQGTAVRLFNSYGPSETTVVATCQVHEGGALTLGYPLAGRQLAVVNAQGYCVAKGQSGELLLIGAGVGQGYWRLPQMSARAFLSSTTLLPSMGVQQGRYYRTGDRVRMLPDGRLIYLGRFDHQVKISGQRIDLLDIEQALLQLQGVAQGAVVLRQSEEHQTFLAAFVVAEACDPLQMRQQLRQQLPDAMVPSCIVLMEQLPKNAAGKVDRLALQQWPLEDSHPDNTVVFTKIQQQIATIWQSVLGTGTILPQDDFFALGGQSLQTLQVATRLSELFGREVAIADLFRYPTLEGLAQALQGHAAQRLDYQQDIQTLSAQMLSFPIAEYQRQPRYRILTGATGFVGIWLLQALLRDTQQDVLCLIRADSEAAAWSKLHQAARQQHMELADVSRIRIVLADLAQDDFGLTESEYHKLICHAIEIFHNAALTSVMRDYASLRDSNVLGTLRLLQLAAQAGCPLHFVSTIAVAPPQAEADALPESGVAAHSGLMDGYQQSKWVAESLVDLARLQGVDSRIYRLGRVVGARKTDTFVNDTDLVWNILAAVLRQGAIPDLAFAEPWTPVNDVANTLIRFALSGQGPTVANLVPTHWLSIQQLFLWLQQITGRLTTMPIADWCQRLAQSDEADDQTLYHFFEQRKQGVAAMAPVITSQTQQAMHTLGLSWPNIDQAQFQAYVEAAVRQGRIVLPRSLPLEEV